MGHSQTEVGRVVEEYVKEYLPVLKFKRTLAKKLYADRPDLFKSVGNARDLVRYYTGSKGDSNRKFHDTEHGHKNERLSDIMKRYYLSPEVNGSTEPFPIEESRVGIISDLHIPYHALDAVMTALEHFKEEEINALLINGDLVDFYQISRFSKDPTRAHMQYEINMCLEFFEMLREYYGNDMPIYYKIGNHEERFDAYMKGKAAELYGMDEFSFSTIMHLDEYNVQLIGGRQKVQIGKLDVLHGHEFGQSFFSPVNPARGLFLRAKSTCLAGHNHQTSEHHENNLKRDGIATWSTGCLCELQPEYRPFAYTKWNHGAAMVEVDKDGSFMVDNFRIINGKIR